LLRRIAILLLYGIYLLLFFWVLYQDVPISSIERWAAPISLGLTLILFYLYTYTLKKTEVKNMIRQKDEALDERQISVRNNAYRVAYIVIVSIISGLCVYIMMDDPNWIAQHIELVKLIFISLFFLGISLPTAILAWTEEEI